MNYVTAMKELESFKDVKGNFPNKVLFESFVSLYFFFNKTSKISPISELHNNRKNVSTLLEKGSFVLDNIGRIDRGE